MKHLLALIFTLVSMSAVAAELKKSAAKADDAKNTVLLNLGLLGAYGVFGFSYERMLTNNIAAQAGAGIDLTGPVNTLGARYYADAKSSGPEWWDKCFFFFNCDRRNYAGFAVQYSPETQVEVIADDIQRNSKYNLGSRTLALANVGVKTVYRSGFVSDVNISYKSILSESQIENISGPDVQADHNRFHAWEKGLGVGVGFGYIF